MDYWEYVILLQLYHEQENWRNGRTSYKSDECPIRLTNDDISKIEVYEWLNDPPKRYTLYIDLPKRTATTWTGDTLGKITRVGPTKRTSGYASCRWNSINIEGTNNLSYYGRFYPDSGDYCHIKAHKNQ